MGHLPNSDLIDLQLLPMKLLLIWTHNRKLDLYKCTTLSSRKMSYWAQTDPEGVSCMSRQFRLQWYPVSRHSYFLTNSNYGFFGKSLESNTLVGLDLRKGIINLSLNRLCLLKNWTRITIQPTKKTNAINGHIQRVSSFSSKLSPLKSEIQRDVGACQSASNGWWLH